MDSDITCLQSLVDMAKLFKANIKVIHVAVHNDEDAKQLMEEFKSNVIENIFYENISFEILVGNNIEQRIDEYLEEEEKTDLLVMSAHQRSLMGKLFGKSITRVMSLYLKVPLMVFHHKAKNAKRIKNHKNIAIHLEEATKKHNDAAKYHEAGDYDRAYNSAVQAHDHMALAAKAQTEMLKHYTFTS